MSEIKHIQKTLTPIVLNEGMLGYNAVLDIEEKLNDKDVFNIAVTGPYGSGKSTVLKSLKTKFFDKHKFLTISLASLTGEKKAGSLNEEEQKKVEFSILQQLIYKEKPRTLPNSRFRRISNRSVTHSVWFGIAIIAFITSFFVVFEPKAFRVDTICHVLDLGERWNVIFDITCSLYMLLCLFNMVAYFFRRSNFMSIKALSFKDVAIELSEESSVFNKHLEEIVYFFESTNYDVVIIEDLDRFECPEIFQKLREINFLLQQSEVLREQARKIKFIYAVKDDLFKDAERTKFFDYIITVIPVVNPKNSCEKLSQELAERGYTIDRDVLLDLSEFVDDMRMLKNVVNEFQQYMERLVLSSTPNKEKLLAMIIYKNHHPDDFGKLHYKDGAVYEFINKKSDWIKIASDKVIEPKLQLWEKKKDELIKTQIFTMKQWRMLYMAKMREHLSTTLISIVIKGQSLGINAIADSEELFEELIKQKRITFSYTSYYNRSDNNTVDNPFVTVEKEVDEKIGYFERKKILSRPASEIDNEIRRVREEETHLKNFKLAKLLVQFPEIKENEAFKKIPLSPLMIHFLQRAYIDETYYDYMTVFDGTVLSLNDRDLLSRIKQNSPQVSYDENIDDMDAFVNEIPRFVFEYKSILNYQIADYLEDHPVIWKSALELFESHFIDASMPPLDFLAQYYKSGGSGVQKLWRKYVKSSSSWLRIQTYEKKEYWDILVEAWLKYSEPTNIDNTIINWLNVNLGFCIERLETIGAPHLKDIIKDCMFLDISPLGPIGDQYQGEDVMDVAKYILENKLFILTNNNILTACEVSGSPFNNELTIDTVTMTDILSSDNQGFKEYVEENIRDVYIGCVSKCKGQEEEIGLIYILNHEKLEEQEKIEYLLLQTRNKVLDVADINDPFKPLAVRGNVLFACWENVLTYYAFDLESISVDLESFINENVDLLLMQDYPTENSSTLAGDIVYGHYLKTSVYEKLLPFLIIHADKEDESKLSKDTGIERVKLLVNNNHLSEKPETASVISQYGAPLFAKYLSNHINSLNNNFKDYSVDTKTLSILLDKGSSLNNAQRWNLAKNVSADVIKQDAELANVILSIMLRRKEELTWTVVDMTMKKATNMSNKKLFQEWLLKKYHFDVEKVATIIETMTYPYNEIVDYTKRPLIPKDFKEYLDLIQPLGLFTSYKEEKSGYRVYHSTK